MARYAEGTAVSVEKSRAEIEKLVRAHGADAFMSASDATRAVISFRARGLLIQFVLTLPDRRAKVFTQDPRSYWKDRPAAVAQKHYDAEVRRLWRALALVIKAKLEAAQSGIETFEEAFLAHIVTPDKRTVGEVFLPQLAELRERGRMPQLMPGTRE
jgi:hypothetical protein